MICREISSIYIGSGIRLKFKQNKLHLAVASVISVSTFSAIAQESSETKEMETIVVTASRSQQTLNDVPRSVTVIDKEQLSTQLKQSRSINDVLSTLCSRHGNVYSR